METNTARSVVEICAIIALCGITIASNVSGDANWVMPLVIICLIFWVFWLLIREDDWKKQNELHVCTIEVLERECVWLRMRESRDSQFSHHSN